MNADGSGVRRLNRSPGFDGVPVPFPNGRAIAFQRGVARGDDFHWDLLRIALPDSAGALAADEVIVQESWSAQVPSFSPDGRRMVYFANPSGRDQLFVRDLGTGRSTPVAASDSVETSPAWSPNGEHIAFVSTRSGTNDLYCVVVASGNVHRITQGLDVWAQPSWSADGSTLLFSAQEKGVHDVFSIGHDGRSLRRLTDGNRGVR
jgi:Tol biopolymer transport system component